MSDIFGVKYLLSDTSAEDIMTPEKFSEEQLEFYRTARNFMLKSVMPKNKELEAKEKGLIVSMLKEAGELGLFMVGIPEKYDGLELDETTAMLVTEATAMQGSFTVSYGAHVGIGTMPIIFFGNHEQKQRYLPKAASGEWLGAYALTEATAGSDAMSARTKAVLSEDGKYYTVNGSKQFITSAGFADYFIVFAKIDGQKFTAFIIDSNSPGVTVEPEEHKMGLRGSSTTAITFEDVKVPAENLLGEIGKGHKIAFNILNMGRMKLGVAVTGAGKEVLAAAVKYANERQQFKQTISSFGIIQEKIANMNIKIYAAESMSYRTTGYIDVLLGDKDKHDDNYGQEVIKAMEEMNIEASIMKVWGSEMLDYVTDEAVQIHGGYGYIEEFPAAEQAYRDSRINRIFEGTNEINRMLIPGTILKRSMTGRLPMMEVVDKLTKKIKKDQMESKGEGRFDDLTYYTNLAKNITLFCFDASIKGFMMDLANQQEVLRVLADLVMDTYTMDSSVVRVMQTAEIDAAKSDFQELLARAFVMETYVKVVTNARLLLPSLAEGKEKKLNKLLKKFDKLVDYPNFDLISAKRQVAAKVIERESYVCD